MECSKVKLSESKEEYRKKPKYKSHCIYIEKELLNSKAWFNLRGSAPQVYLIFLSKKQMVKTGKKGHERWVCINGQEIIFTYAEAKKKHGITQPRFTRAIDDLIKHGFIEITESASGMFKSATMYAISERWQQYGTPQFKKVERSKGGNIGFRKYNCKKEIQPCIQKHMQKK